MSQVLSLQLVDDSAGCVWVRYSPRAYS